MLLAEPVNYCSTLLLYIIHSFLNYETEILTDTIQAQSVHNPYCCEDSLLTGVGLTTNLCLFCIHCNATEEGRTIDRNIWHILFDCLIGVKATSLLL